jgi:hypothetical protein
MKLTNNQYNCLLAIPFNIHTPLLTEFQGVSGGTKLKFLRGFYKK